MPKSDLVRLRHMLVAANEVTAECRTRYPQIPWMDAIGMRHRLIHAYYDVNLDILWATITKDLPLLVSEVEKAVDMESTIQ